MFLKTLVHLLLLFSSSLYAQEIDPTWYSLPNGTGYVNKQGKLLKIEKKLYITRPFSDGLACVGFDEEIKYGFINTKGEIVVGPQFEEAENFSDSYAVIRYGVNKYDIINKTGNKVKKNLYTAKSFSEGIGIIRYTKDDSKIAVDSEFKELFKIEDGMVISPFSDGLAIISNLSPRFSPDGYIDITGKVVIKPQFKYASNFSEGVAVVNKTQFINKKGEFILKDINFELAGIKVINKKGVYDLNSAAIELADGFYEGLCRIIFIGQIWCIDHEGKLAFKNSFTNLSRFKDGIASASKDQKDMWEIFGDYVTSFKDPLVDDAKYGFINKKGEWIIKPKYSYARVLPEGGGVAEVRFKNKEGKKVTQLIVVPENGRVIWEKSN